MALPVDFQQVEHLQDTIRRALNPEIREWFRDVTDDELDISTPRSSLRTACTHQDADSLLETATRMLLFEFLVRRPWRASGGESGSRPPHHVYRKERPRVVLYFEEDDTDVDPGYSPVRGEVGFRLMEETGLSLTEGKLVSLGTKVKSKFGRGAGFVWKKGRGMLSYTDWEKGYQLQVLCFSKEEGKRVVEQTLDLQNHTPDWAFAQFSENLEESQAYPTIPPTQQVLGASRRLARRRPRADIRFQYAYIEVPGLPNKIYLYDESGMIPDAVVKQS
jgi:hypothetical protein